MGRVPSPGKQMCGMGKGRRLVWLIIGVLLSEQLRHTARLAFTCRLLNVQTVLFLSALPAKCYFDATRFKFWSKAGCRPAYFGASGRRVFFLSTVLPSIRHCLYMALFLCPRNCPTRHLQTKLHCIQRAFVGRIPHTMAADRSPGCLAYLKIKLELIGVVGCKVEMVV